MSLPQWVEDLSRLALAPMPERSAVEAVTGRLEDPTGYGEQLRGIAPELAGVREVSLGLRADGTPRSLSVLLEPRLPLAAITDRFGPAEPLPDPAASGPNVALPAAAGRMLARVDGGEVDELWWDLGGTG